MKRALETDHAVALAAAGLGHGAAHHFHHALVRLCARIAEEDAVGKARIDQALRQALGPRRAIEVGHVHHPRRLLGNSPG
jgi:hypothetical protein